MSFDFGGDGFVVRRQSLLLAGLNGYSARASVAYRLTRRQTISASYDNTYFDFQRAFGEFTAAKPRARVFDRVSPAIGTSARRPEAVRVDTLGLTQVPLDPAIAALIGQNFADGDLHQRVYLPVAEARLIRRLQSGHR